MTDSWTLPAPLATAEVHMDDGALINIRRHGNPEGPRIVLSHGWNPVSDLQAHARHFWTFVNDNTTILQAIDRHGRKPD